MPEEDDLRARLQDLLEQSRESGEKFVADVGKVLDNIRSQLGNQLGQMGLVTKEDLARLERKIDDLAASGSTGKESGKGSTGKQKSGPGKASGKKSAGKKSADAA